MYVSTHLENTHTLGLYPTEPKVVVGRYATAQNRSSRAHTHFSKGSVSIVAYVSAPITKSLLPPVPPYSNFPPL